MGRLIKTLCIVDHATNFESFRLNDRFEMGQTLGILHNKPKKASKNKGSRVEPPQKGHLGILMVVFCLDLYV